MNKRFFSALPMFLWDTVDNGGSAPAMGKEAKPDPKSGDEPVETTKPSLLTRDELVEENARLKNRITNLNRENSEHRQAAKQSDDDKAELAAYRAVGFKPDDLKKELDEGRSAKTKNAETERMGELEKAAKANTWKSVLLKRLAPNLPVFSKEVDVKGEDSKFTKETKWFFKDGDKEIEMTSYFADDEETLSLLRAEEAGTNRGGVNTTAQVQTRRYIEQGGGSTRSTKSVVDERQDARREERAQKTNPLMKR